MAKTKTTKRTSKAKQQTAGDAEVTVCRRRGDRRQTASKTSEVTESAVKNEEITEVDKVEMEESAEVVQLPPMRPKVQRRRQIDPTTCERDYTDDEIEFMHALDAYKRSSGRMFPTCSEILEVVRDLGYARVEGDEADSTEAPITDAEPTELSAESTEPSELSAELTEMAEAGLDLS